MTASLDSRQRVLRRTETTVRRFMDAHALWPADDSGVLVAVSGGPDSTALLLLLSRLAQRRGQRLVVAHFDHGLRGPEVAEAEAASVRSLADSLSLALILGAGDARGRARRQHLSLEDAARRERYAFLASAATESGCSFVATGHTASDQAETVLLHLVRGAGLAGIAGMRPKAGWPFAGHTELTLIRPLLGLSRADTLAYCDASAFTPVEDASNASDAFLRNRVRHELLPLLQSFNPGIEDALVRLAESAAGDAAYLESLATALVTRADGDIMLPRKDLAAAPESLRRHTLRLALEAASSDEQGFSARHVAALERLILKGRTGDSVDLPERVRATLTREALELRLGAVPGAIVLPEEGVQLSVPGVASLGALAITASLHKPAADTIAQVDAEVTGASLTVRRRRNGDRFQPLGMTGTKKLQDFFVDSRVPRDQRDAVPLFESARGIVWVGGLRIAEWCKPQPGRRTVFLSYQPLDS
jgi:tRNA(Ile)-lysidine synthase